MVWFHITKRYIMNSAIRISLFTLYIYIFIPIVSFSQNLFWGEAESELKFKHLQTQDGLSSNITSVILEDQKGYMWFGTDAGLNRFDGFQIKTYNYGDG